MANSNFFDLSKSSFEILINKLFAIAMSKTKNTSDANDLVQITLEKALKSKDSFDGKNLDGWLITILKNSFFDFYRKEQNKNEISMEDEFQTTVEGNQSAEILKSDIEKCFKELNEIDREIFAHLYNGEAYSEIAEFVNISVGAIKTRINRSRKDLRVCLDRY